MSESRPSRIERRLSALAAAVELPPAPDLSARVRAEIESSGQAPAAGRRRLRLAAIWGACLLAIGGVAYASPLRDEIRDLAGIDGVEVEPVRQLPETEKPARLGLGEPIAPGRAAELVGFLPLTAEGGILAGPHRLFAGSVGDGPVISFAYPASARLPAIGRTAVGLVLTQFEAGDGAVIVKKILAGTDPVQVRVGRSSGFWIGAEHAVAFPVDPSAPAGPPRLARHVLIWQRGSLILRLEANLPKHRAVVIAESLRQGRR